MNKSEHRPTDNAFNLLELAGHFGHHGWMSWDLEYHDGIKLPANPDQDTVAPDVFVDTIEQLNKYILKHEAGIFYVTVYDVNRSMYSGAEGGCWYDHGEPKADPRNRVFQSRQAARNYVNALNNLLDQDDNLDRPGIDSVICSGVARAFISYNELPKPFPDHTPTYE